MKNTRPFHLSLLFLKYFWIMMAAYAPVWGILLLLVGAMGIVVGVLEGIGWTDGLYFGFITGMTIGYGDITPTSGITRILSVVIGFVGIIITGLFVTMAVNAGQIVAQKAGIVEDMKKRIREQLENGDRTGDSG